MIVKEKAEIFNLDKYIIDIYSLMDIAFFDIETTGFNKEEDKIILISLGYFKSKDKFNIIQYFAEDFKDEKELLTLFLNELKRFNKWCSYNGLAFDEPFIRKRTVKNNVKAQLPTEHIDLYRMIRPFYKQLGMERCNLKTVEKFIGVKREDKIDGGMSIELYYEFLESKSEELKNKIMLHNYEDVLNLPKIFQVIYDIEHNPKLVRENNITKKQYRYLISLLDKFNLALKHDIHNISKKSASRLIDSILRGDRDVVELKNIIKNSY